jgi:hypothetical protein
MTGHRSFSDLKRGWNDKRRATNEVHKAELATEYATLDELLVALGLSQEQMAQRLDVQPPAVSSQPAATTFGLAHCEI